VTSAIVIPAPGQPIAVIRRHADLLEAFRTIKAILALSNDFCDERGGMTRGHTDKMLGPSSTKGLSAMGFDTFTSMFAVEFHMMVDMDQVRVMEARWEARHASNVRAEPNRVSQKILERAKPHIIKDMAKLGGKASGAKRTGSQGTEIMRKVAKARWRKQRARERASKAMVVT
jgi:hypothetical protein